jgi:hypothetical protein
MMNTTQRWTIAIIAAVAIGAALFLGGSVLAQANGNGSVFGPGNMMTGYAQNPSGTQYGMMSGTGMNGGMMGTGGMMGYGQTYTGTVPYGSRMMGGYGMMGGTGNRLSGVKPLTVDQAKQAVNNYLAGLNNPDLVISEIMIFDNNAYARITEKSTGMGAFELLVDPATLSVFPEYGPNMMWNLKYGMMGGYGGQGMMGRGMTLAPALRSGASAGVGGFTAPNTTGQMPVTADQARQIAQRYLDTYQPGAQADQKPDPFYGYYTIDTLRDDKPVGMLSVNGYTQQVLVHTWHGNFIEMSED